MSSNLKDPDRDPIDIDNNKNKNISNVSDTQNMSAPEAPNLGGNQHPNEGLRPEGNDEEKEILDRYNLKSSGMTPQEINQRNIDEVERAYYCRGGSAADIWGVDTLAFPDKESRNRIYKCLLMMTHPNKHVNNSEEIRKHAEEDTKILNNTSDVIKNPKKEVRGSRQRRKDASKQSCGSIVFRSASRKHNYHKLPKKFPSCRSFIVNLTVGHCKLFMAGRYCLVQSCTQQCIGNLSRRLFCTTRRVFDTVPEDAIRTALAPKPNIDIRHIRRWPSTHEKNCKDRGYLLQAKNPEEIIRLFDDWKELQFNAKRLRERNNELQRQLSIDHGAEKEVKQEILVEAKELKANIKEFEEQEEKLDSRIQDLAIALPNLSSEHTPVGTEPLVLEYINEHPDATGQDYKTTSHTVIGATLDILDFAAAGTTSGWGFYYLKNEAALLEQALVQYALKVAKDHGFKVVTPPSMVYSHISNACGFRPRDRNEEQQIYSIAQHKRHSSKPEMTLAGTAEIPFAAMKAFTDMKATDLPLRIVGSSRCYRAEAGGRGVETKGLYRVHEFTKVEMFGWTMPDGSENELFSLMMLIQKTILQSLGLHCRVLEQPTSDLGASAARKQDIEAFFPSRRKLDNGWGEVTSTSICTDYQTRRLATRVRASDKFVYPHTVNGTALAVPRVLAAILENHWDEKEQIVRIPKVLQPWMSGQEVIRPAGDK